MTASSVPLLATKLPRSIARRPSLRTAPAAGKSPVDRPCLNVRLFIETEVLRSTETIGTTSLPSSVMSPPPSIAVLSGTIRVAVNAMTTGLGPHRNRMVPPPLDRAISRAGCNVTCVQLAAVPRPTMIGASEALGEGRRTSAMSQDATDLGARSMADLLSPAASRCATCALKPRWPCHYHVHHACQR